MKVFAASALVAQCVMASWDQMLNDYNALVPFLNATGNRALTQDQMNNINQYGCWCYFEGDHGQGRGVPVDEIDAQCKVLHDGYYCAISDAELRGETCVPWEVTYDSAIGIGLGGIDLSNVRQECTDTNTDLCARDACMIEGYFVGEFVLKVLDGVPVDQDKRHVNGFEKIADCPISGNGMKSEKSCCGDQPLRFPFKTYDGARMCCHGHTYNTNLYQCCDDGTTKMSCTD